MTFYIPLIQKIIAQDLSFLDAQTFRHSAFRQSNTRTNLKKIVDKTIEFDIVKL